MKSLVKQILLFTIKIDFFDFVSREELKHKEKSLINQCIVFCKLSNETITEFYDIKCKNYNSNPFHFRPFKT